ncbi:hypothetical protein [Pseudooceanicola sp.]
MAGALWLLFLGAGGAGYLWNGAVGALVALAACFVFAVLFIAPVLIVSDMRRTLVSIEKRLAGRPGAAAPSSPVLKAVPRPAVRQVSLSREPEIPDASLQSETKPAEPMTDRPATKTVLRAQK